MRTAPTCGLVGKITCLRFSAAKLTAGAMEIGGNSKYQIKGVGNIRPKCKEENGSFEH